MDGTIVEQRKAPTRKFRIADAALAAGHEVRVVPATLVRLLGVGDRGVKNDQRDPQQLSKASWQTDVPSIHIPSKAARELKSIPIVNVSVEARESPTHNLTVDGTHTYYVAMAGDAVLVHNQTLQDAIRAQAPIDIPQNAVLNQTTITQVTGAWNFGWRWEANGVRYKARFHSPSPGAVAAGDERNIWVIQRGTGFNNPQQVLSENGQWVPYTQHAMGQTGRATHLSSRRGDKITPCP